MKTGASRLLGVGAALMGISLAASAGPGGDSVSFSIPSPGYGSDTFSLATFNESLGTLTAVTFIVSGTETAYATVINVGNSAGSFASESTSGAFSLTGTGINPLSVTLSDSLPDTGSPYSIAAGAPVTYLYGPGASNTLDLTETVTTGLDAFLGANSYTVGFGPFTSSITGTSSANVLGGATANASGTVTVEYFYTATPVPEPETCAMLLSGLGLIGVMAGRRKKNIISSLTGYFRN